MLSVVVLFKSFFANKKTSGSSGGQRVYHTTSGLAGRSRRGGRYALHAGYDSLESARPQGLEKMDPRFREDDHSTGNTGK